jgi:hypothetical protein
MATQPVRERCSEVFRLLNLFQVMIILRIWRVEKRSAASRADSVLPSRRPPLQFVRCIVIDSALMYTSTLIFALVTSILRSRLQYIATAIVSRSYLSFPFVTSPHYNQECASSGNHVQPHFKSYHRATREGIGKTFRFLVTI